MNYSYYITPKDTKNMLLPFILIAICLLYVSTTIYFLILSKKKKKSMLSEDLLCKKKKCEQLNDVEDIDRLRKLKKYKKRALIRATDFINYDTPDGYGYRKWF